MVIFHLIIAHLLGDFVFQSNSLIRKKYESWRGTFEHACIITLFTTLLLFPYWQEPLTWIAIGTVAVIHFIQDVLKVEIDKRYNPNHNPLPFFIDQILHVSLLMYLSRILNNLSTIPLPGFVYKFYFSPVAMALITGILLLSFVIEIVMYQFKHYENKKNLNKEMEFTPDRLGMAIRVGTFAVFYFLMVLTLFS